MAIIWLILALALLLVLFVYSALCLASDDDDETEAEIAEQREPPKKTWLKYPVPLDDTLQKYIQQKCDEYQIPTAVVMAVIGTESQYNADAIGDHGNSLGLMQIYQSYHLDRMKRLGCYNLYNPYQNVRVGIDFLAELIERADGDIEWALSYYSGNGGAECEYARNVMRLSECILEGVMVQSG